VTPYEELFAIADRLEAASSSAQLTAANQDLDALDTVGLEAGRAFSGLWLGYHSRVYYEDLQPPPPGAHFSQEWGLMDTYGSSHGSHGDWLEYDAVELVKILRAKAGSPDLTDVQSAAGAAEKIFRNAQAEASG
jgi:hypothetical protein